MSLSPEEVIRISHLARLAVSDQEIPQYARELSNILDVIAQMEGTNTTDVAPLSNPTDANQRLREDNVTESDQRETFQQGAPLAEAGLYLVPKVIE